MTSMAGRLIRLEERAPKGCPTCRAWGAASLRVIVQGIEGSPARGDGCPDCGRHVPLQGITVHIVERPDGPA